MYNTDIVYEDSNTLAWIVDMLIKRKIKYSVTPRRVKVEETPAKLWEMGIIEPGSMSPYYPTCDLSPKHPIVLFAYFAFNYPPGFIKIVWKDNPHLIEHLEEKFRMLYDTYGAHSVIIRFFLALSPGHQVKFATWITENYKG